MNNHIDRAKLNAILTSYNTGMQTIIPSSVNLEKQDTLIDSEYINLAMYSLTGYAEYDNPFSNTGLNDTIYINDTLMIFEKDIDTLDAKFGQLVQKVFPYYKEYQVNGKILYLASAMAFYHLSHKDTSFSKKVELLTQELNLLECINKKTL